MEKPPSLQENPRQEFLSDLKHLRDNYKGGFPDEIKSSTSPDSQWKVRKAWFASVKILFYRIRNKFTLPTELTDEIVGFEKRKIGDENNLTTQEDMDVADQIIGKVIMELEK